MAKKYNVTVKTGYGERTYGPFSKVSSVDKFLSGAKKRAKKYPDLKTEYSVSVARKKSKF